MRTSIIIPVYNAAPYVIQAVESALAQPETAEIILVEDGSKDASLALCEQLAAQYEKVHLLRHPGGENRGAGASRNLGMQNAHYDYIAFLDADDYYLPGRFEVAKEVFDSNPSCEGVYEAIEMHVESEEGLKRWKKAKRPSRQLQTLEQRVCPTQLAAILIQGGSGSFHPNGLVIKKNVLQKAGYMEEVLPLHQDTNFNIKLALTSNLYPGRLEEPVARWRIHSHNRISNQRSKLESGKAKIRLWLVTYRWSQDHASNEMQRLILSRLLFFTVITPLRDSFSPKLLTESILVRIRLINLLIIYPPIIFKSLFWKKMIPRQLAHEK